MWERIFAAVPFDVRAMTVGTFLDAMPSGTWAVSASNHFIASANGVVADSGACNGNQRIMGTLIPNCL